MYIYISYYEYNLNMQNPLHARGTGGCVNLGVFEASACFVSIPHTLNRVTRCKIPNYFNPY